VIPGRGRERARLLPRQALAVLSGGHIRGSLYACLSAPTAPAPLTMPAVVRAVQRMTS
jgi:hypothetical protein